MAEFDPYLSWLGIRDPRRPPNHYRMLGLELFEDDPDVILNAADRHMSHVRTYQTGKHSELSQKLLNEISSAKLCLLNPAKRADYDARLRAEQAAAEQAAMPPPPPLAHAAPTGKPPVAQPIAVGIPVARQSAPTAVVRPASVPAMSPMFETTPSGSPSASPARLLIGVAAGVMLLAAIGLGWWATRPKPEVLASNPPPVAEVVEPIESTPKPENPPTPTQTPEPVPEITPPDPDDPVTPPGEEKPPVALAPPLGKFEAAIAQVALLKERALAAAGDTLSVWSLESDSEIAQVTAERRTILALAVSPDESQTLCGGIDGVLQRWDLQEGLELGRLDSHQGPVLCAAWSRQGKLAATGGQDGRVRVWDMQTGEEIARLAELKDPIEAISLSSSGQIAAVGTRSGQVRVWDVFTGRELAALTHPENRPKQRTVHAVSLSRDGQRLAYGLGDGTARIIAIEDQNEVHRLRGHRGVVHSAVFYAGDQRLLTGSADGNLRVWNVETGRELQRIAVQSPVLSIAVSADGKRALSGSQDGSLRKWTLPPPPSFEEETPAGPERMASGLLLKWKGPAGESHDAALSPDDRHVALASAHTHVSVWELRTAEDGSRSVGEAVRLGPHPGGAASVVFLNDEELLTAGVDGVLRLWNLRSRGAPRSITAHNAPVYQLISAQGGQLVLSADDDHQARLWNFPAGKSQIELEATGRADRWDLSADGQRVVSAGYDRTLRWRNASDGREARRVAGKSWFASVGLVPGGNFVITGGADGLLRVWSAEQEVLRLAGHKGAIWGLSVGVDGAQAISGGQDKSVRVWDLASGRQVALYSEHAAPVVRTAISQKGQLALSLDRSGELCLWSLPPLEKLEPDPEAIVSSRERLPAPEKGAVTAGEVQIRNVYRADYAKRIPSEKSALATRLLERGQATEVNDPLRYVLWSEAKEQASGAGDVATSLAAIDLLSKSYEVDGLEVAAESLTETARTVKTPEAHSQLVREALKRADLALGEDRHDLALKFVAIATRTAVKLNSPLVSGFTTSRDRMIKVYKNDFDRLKKQVERLAEEPADPEANLALGKYYALSVGDWSRGLPLMALGSDAALARLAARELRQPSDAASLREMGGQWTSVAAEETRIPWKTAMQIRAYDRYRDALTEVNNDETRKFLEEQLTDLAKQLAPRASVYLSSMPEAEAVVGNGRFGKGGMLGYTSPGGDRIRVRGQLSPNGLSMYPPAVGSSHVAYGAFQQFRTLQATVGIADTASIARVATPLTFVVICDGEVRWRSDPIRGRGQTQDVLLDITGVEKLVLEVECTDENTGCQAVWLEPRLWPFKLK